MSGVETMLAGGLGLKAVAMMKQASLTMKRAARQAFAMAADANLAAINARTAETELQRYVQGAPVVMSPASTMDGHIDKISSFGSEIPLVLAGTVGLHQLVGTSGREGERISGGDDRTDRRRDRSKRINYGSEKKRRRPDESDVENKNFARRPKGRCDVKSFL
ncbi:unnamed protein product [Amoebophrya sp. A120]|nr:unnamed protein product [Amoebophrya sp. A120]|eukprot:GSA120T00023636001.1